MQDRVRAREQSMDGQFYTVYWRQVPLGIWPSVRRTDSIQDVIGYPKTRPPMVTGCTHTKCEASIVEDSTSFRCYHNDGQLVLGPPATQVSCKLAFNASEDLLDLPWSSVDWVTLTTSMADQVNGLINSRSQLAVTFYEMHKTWKMVRNPFSLLKRDWRKVCGKSTASQLARKGANLWLENAYGWRPLFNDARNLAVSVANWTKVSQKYVIAKGSTRFGNSAVISGICPEPTISNSEWNSRKALLATGPDSCSWPWPYNWRIVYDPSSHIAHVGCRVSDSVMDHNSRLRRALSVWGLDPGRDLLPTLWEVVPYSFVVDWFVNTRGLMNLARYNAALGVLHQASVSGLCYSLRGECTYQAEVLPFYDAVVRNQLYWGFPPYTIVSGALKSVFTGTKGVWRKYVRVAGVPPATIGTLFSTKGLSLSNLVSGLALISQRLHR